MKFDGHFKTFLREEGMDMPIGLARMLPIYTTILTRCEHLRSLNLHVGPSENGLFMGKNFGNSEFTHESGVGEGDLTWGKSVRWIETMNNRPDKFGQLQRGLVAGLQEIERRNGQAKKTGSVLPRRKPIIHRDSGHGGEAQ